MHLQPAHVAQVYDTTPSIQDLCSIDGSSIIIAIFPPTYIRLKWCLGTIMKYQCTNQARTGVYTKYTYLYKHNLTYNVNQTK